MRLTRLLVRNYRVYEDAVELELPGGLVGIYGPNGAGKSVLLEAITFSLYGRARTTVDEVRTSGVGGECLAEVEFEHEGHLYVVRRTISGTNATVKAEAHADGLLVTAGARDTSRFVRSTIGMDDAAFRASVFAEQKQVAAFSSKQPAERRKLVLQLLGITPLDGASAAARKEAKRLRESHDTARRTLPDVDERRAALAAADEAAATATAAEADAAAAEATAAAAVEEAGAALAALEALGREHEAIVAEGKAVKAEHDAAAAQVSALTEELAALDGVEAELAALRPLADGLAAAEARLAALTRLHELEARLAALAVPDEPPDPDPAPAAAAATAAEEAAARVADLRGRRAGAQAELQRAEEALARSGGLSGEADCPLCGQALGDAFAQVQRHRAEEAEGARARLAELDGALASALDAAARAREAAVRTAAALEAAKAARAAWSEVAAARRALADEVVAYRASLQPPPRDGELDVLLADVETAKAAAARGHQLAGRLERRPAARAALERAAAVVADTTGRLDALREKRRALGFDPQRLDALRAACRVTDAALATARGRSRKAEADAAAARVRAEGALAVLRDAEAQHERLSSLAEDARHVGRTADLLLAFRNELVAEVGPRLSTQAAGLFAELTDREYDELRVDPDTYEVRIVDSGVEYGMDRFSGSETDLANLALRVAISEHVRFQSGGQVGLLVLDEVFGPLDDERKERMLLALERLRARFRQVLVVTHDREIKEQLPTAVEVVKLPGRRATARLLGA